MALAALLSDGYLRREDMEGPEFYVLMLLSAFRLWLAFVLCLVGLRAVLSSG